MKKKIKRIISVMICAVMISASLTGCNNKKPSPEDEAAAAAAAAKRTELIEVNQNDYRGAYFRAEAIKQTVLNIIEGFNERNTAIEAEHPSDFWLSDSYKYLSVNLLNDEVWVPMVFLNETETDWETAAEATYSNFKNEKGNWTVDSLTLTRKEANVYELVYSKNETVPYYKNGEKKYNFKTTYKVNYDANHDWAQCARYRTGNGLTICDGLFEYARLNETEFVIQTVNERLYIKYEDGLFDYDNNTTNIVEGGSAVDEGTETG